MKFCNKCSGFLSLEHPAISRTRCTAARLLLKSEREKIQSCTLTGRNEMYVSQADSEPAALSVPGNERLSVSGLLSYSSSQDGAGGRSCSEVRGKLTGLTAPSPTLPLCPPHVHTPGHFYGNALFT